MSEAKIAGDSVHFYLPDGSPLWTIVGKNGRERTPYVKEALAKGAVPGVTTITKQVWSYGLQNYFVEQGIWAALTLPRWPEETDEDYIARVKEDSKEHGRKRADEGTELHKAIDLYVLQFAGSTEKPDPKWSDHIAALTQALAMHGYDLRQGKPQVTFATSHYGGTADLVFTDAIWDWKTKDTLDGKKRLAYDDHCMQLVAYDRGIAEMRFLGDLLNGKANFRKLFNVFVGCKDAKVQVHSWDDEKDIRRCWNKFQCLVNLWWLENS